MNRSKTIKIAAGFIIAVVVVFILLLVKTRNFPAKPHPQIDQELLQALQKFEQLDDAALVQINNRLAVITASLKALDASKDYYASWDGPLTTSQRQHLVEIITQQQMEWTTLKSQENLNKKTNDELENTIKGLELGESRDDLLKTIDMLAQGTEIQKNEFTEGDSNLSTLISNFQLLRSDLDGVAGQDTTGNLKSTLESMTLSLESAVSINKDQKDEVLGNEVTVQALKKILDSLPVL